MEREGEEKSKYINKTLLIYLLLVINIEEKLPLMCCFLDDFCHKFLREWWQKLVRIHLHSCYPLAVATNVRVTLYGTFFSHFLRSWAAKRLPDHLVNGSRVTWSQGFYELLRIRGWDINICCFCELASSPSCGSEFPDLGETEGISSRCFNLLLFYSTAWPLISSGSVPRLPESLCTFWLSPFTVALEVVSVLSDGLPSHTGCMDAQYL